MSCGAADSQGRFEVMLVESVVDVATFPPSQALVVLHTCSRDPFNFILKGCQDNSLPSTTKRVFSLWIFVFFR